MTASSVGGELGCELRCRTAAVQHDVYCMLRVVTGRPTPVDTIFTVQTGTLKASSICQLHLLFCRWRVGVQRLQPKRNRWPSLSQATTTVHHLAVQAATVSMSAEAAEAEPTVSLFYSIVDEYLDCCSCPFLLLLLDILSVDDWAIVQKLYMPCGRHAVMFCMRTSAVLSSSSVVWLPYLLLTCVVIFWYMETIFWYLLYSILLVFCTFMYILYIYISIPSFITFYKCLHYHYIIYIQTDHSFTSFLCLSVHLFYSPNILPSFYIFIFCILLSDLLQIITVVVAGMPCGDRCATSGRPLPYRTTTTLHTDRDCWASLFELFIYHRLYLFFAAVTAAGDLPYIYLCGMPFRYDNVHRYITTQLFYHGHWYFVHRDGLFWKANFYHEALFYFLFMLFYRCRMENCHSLSSPLSCTCLPYIASAICRFILSCSCHAMSIDGISL